MPNRISEAQVDEISLVTRPAEPNSRVAFFKRDDTEDVIEKKNLSEYINRIQSAWSSDHPYTSGEDSGWVRTVHDKFVVISKDGKSYKVPYTNSGGNIEFGSMEEVILSESITPIGKGQPTSADVMRSGKRQKFMDALASRLGLGAKKAEDEEDEEEEVSEDEMEKSIDTLIISEADRLTKLSDDEGGKTHSSESADDEDGGGMPNSVMESASDEVKEYVTKLEAERDEAVTKTAELEKSAEGSDEGSDDILKSADPALVEMIRKADERAVAAETIAKAERSRRVKREFIAKAETLPHMGEEPDALGDVLRTIHEAVDEDTYEKLDSMLKAAEAKLSESALFTELGKTGGGTTGDAYAQLEAIAKSIQERDSISSPEEAFSKAMDERPELYERYLEEQVV